MKAQAAVLEALIAGTLLFVAMGISYEFAYIASFSGAVESVRMSNAVYDMQALSYSDTNFGECMRNVSHICINNELPSISDVYGLTYIKITVGNRSGTYGNAALCKESDYYCFPVGESAGSAAECVYLCSD